MAETVGSLVDKLSIVELRRWHAEEAMLNPQAPEEVRHECALRLKIIDEQRADLIAELSALWGAILHGGRAPKVYRQLKMYNDARLRDASRPGSASSSRSVMSESEGSSAGEQPTNDPSEIIDFEHHLARKRPTTRHS